jgi:3,4-dihydroxy 2-butanone 4-phosphate synthase/GTP cyclohydrolase II
MSKRSHLQAVTLDKSRAGISPIEEIIAELRAGKMVVLVDDEDRENEGDLVIAADFVSAEAINFMATHGRGLICMPITTEHAAQLNLAPMTSNNRSVHGTNFTVSIEAAQGVTTGISAQDRAHTIRVASRPDAKPSDVVFPGHVFPLIAQPGGVLVRAGHTEACCDLARLAGLTSAAVLCEIMKDDGSMARLPDLLAYARAHSLKIGTIADLIHYRSRNETLVERVGERRVNTPYGEFDLIAYYDRTGREAHLALRRGEIKREEETLVRVHEPISIIDFLDSSSSRHAISAAEALREIAAAPRAVMVLLRRTESADDVLRRFAPSGEADARATKWDPRSYGTGAQILRDLGVGKMRVLAHPMRMPSMVGFDLEITGYVTPQR